MVVRLISGGQTGADRGGLDAAIVLGIEHGGWCPKGRRAEDGQIPACYSLEETVNVNYQARTKRNVLESDGTVIFTRGELAGGSLLTARVARESGKPCLELDLQEISTRPESVARRLLSWIAGNGLRTLNVAGPRESKAPGTQAAVTRFLLSALGPERAPRAYPLEEERVLADRPQLAAAEEAAPYGLPNEPRRRGRRRP